MITEPLNFQVGVNISRGDASRPPTSADDFQEATLLWGTDGSGWNTCGRLNVDGGLRSMQPNLILDKPDHFYTTGYGGHIARTISAHKAQRRAVWVARGVGYGLAGAGVAVASVGVTTPVGLAMVVKGVLLGTTAGVVAGTAGGVYHTKRSIKPYKDHLMLLNRLDDLIGIVNETQGGKSWMHSNKEVAKTRAVAPEVFDHALVELRMAGFHLGQIQDITEDWEAQLGPQDALPAQPPSPPPYGPAPGAVPHRVTRFQEPEAAVPYILVDLPIELANLGPFGRSMENVTGISFGRPEVVRI